MIPNAQTGNNNINPATKAIQIVPADVDLDFVTRLITIGSAGVINFLGVDNKEYTTGVLPAGSYPISAKRILLDTTAGDITGWA